MRVIPALSALALTLGLVAPGLAQAPPRAGDAADGNVAAAKPDDAKPGDVKPANKVLCVLAGQGTTPLELRFGPSSRHAIIGQIAQGTCGLTLVGQCVSGWCEIEIGGRKGWADTRQITVHEPAPAPGPQPAQAKAALPSATPPAAAPQIAAEAYGPPQPYGPPVPAALAAGMMRGELATSASAKGLEPRSATDSGPARPISQAPRDAGVGSDIDKALQAERAARVEVQPRPEPAPAPREAAEPKPVPPVARAAPKPVPMPETRSNASDRKPETERWASEPAKQPVRRVVRNDPKSEPSKPEHADRQRKAEARHVEPPRSSGQQHDRARERHADRHGHGPSHRAGAGDRICVVNVETWDTLRIRSGPGVAHREISSIPARACGIEPHPHGLCRGAWCVVRFRGTAGWVNTSYLARQRILRSS